MVVAVLAAGIAGPAVAQTAPPRLVLPVTPACISSPFGPRILPGKPKAGTYHYGIDLPAPAGAPVRAVAAGRVLTIHKRGPGGQEIAIQHDGFVTLYSHLGLIAPALAEGERTVQTGERIGVIGRTGVTYGTHLYFELRLDGTRVDPAPYLGVQPCGAAKAAG